MSNTSLIYALTESNKGAVSSNGSNFLSNNLSPLQEYVGLFASQDDFILLTKNLRQPKSTLVNLIPSVGVNRFSSLPNLAKSCVVALADNRDYLWYSFSGTDFIKGGN